MKVSTGISKKKRADGYFMGWIRALPAGKRKYIYARSRQELQQRLFDEKVRLEKHLSPTTQTLTEFAEEHLARHGQDYAPSTLRGYNSILRTHITGSALGDTLLADIRHSDIQEFITSMGAKHKTAVNVSAFLHTLFTAAVNDRIIDASPMNGRFRFPPAEKYHYTILTAEQVKTLITSYHGEREGVPVMLAALCGMRLSECMGLRAECVDFAAGTITVSTAAVGHAHGVDIKHPKTAGSQRVIFAPPVVLEALRPYCLQGYIFSNDGKTPWNGNNYSRTVKNRIKALGLPPSRFHDLRHFAATTLMANGLPDKVIAEYLGHSDTDTTRRYQHMIEEMQVKPAAVFTALFDK